MPSGRAGIGRDQRRAPRVDVIMHVRGQVVPVGAPIHVHNLSRTGFAVVSRLPFERGQTLGFRLTAADAPPVLVNARAIHTRPLHDRPELHLSGFQFVAGELTGLVPHALIDQLIAAVSGVAVPAF